MHKQHGQRAEKVLLVFNCHEAWVYQLGALGYSLDVIIGLKGRFKQGWDEQMRPVPRNARMISLTEAQRSEAEYYCIIAHNISDLLDVKLRPEPRLIVIHSTLQGRVREEDSAVEPERMKQMLHTYLELVGGHAVPASMLKGRSWGFTEDVVPFGADPAEYPPYSGRDNVGLRVSNFIENRKKILLWDFYEKAFAEIPVRLVGHNPNMPGVEAAQNWDCLKSMFRLSRFYVHTADPELEDGYNMAALEAMAAGMPVLGNCHPSSPVRHGVSGFLSDDPAELGEYARMLLDDRNLAVKMGKQARKTVEEKFSLPRFTEAFLQSIEKARGKWLKRKVRP